MVIKEWAPEDRPREKMMEKGESALSNAELLAILIGSGTSRQTAVELMREILNDCGNHLSELSRKSVAELMKYSGIGEAKAITIKAAAEIGRRRALEVADDRQLMTDADAVYNMMRPIMQDLSHEEFWVLLLNNNARLLKKVKLSSGGMTETCVDIRMLMKEALLAEATSMIVSHNHPSGQLRPSREDEKLTERIFSAGKSMNIRLLDHVIITDGNYYSFAENGKI